MLQCFDFAKDSMCQNCSKFTSELFDVLAHWNRKSFYNLIETIYSF